MRPANLRGQPGNDPWALVGELALGPDDKQFLVSAGAERQRQETVALARRVENRAEQGVLGRGGRF